jgi:hypothetical protein
MYSSKTIFLFAVVALIMLFVFPIQSINEHSEKLPTRFKRWTFNTWRLHGRRQLANGLICFYLTEFYVFFVFKLDFDSSKTFPVDQNHPYEMLNNENDLAYEHLLELLQKYNRH